MSEIRTGEPDDSIGPLMDPDWGPDWDFDPDADALAFCKEEGLVEGPDGNWMMPDDAAAEWADFELPDKRKDQAPHT